MWVITIFNIKTNQGYVKTTECPETIEEYADTLEENEIMFVNDTEESNE